jgi:hypothetical protein
VLLMLGGFTPLWPLLRQLPGLDGFRFPVRFSIGLTLAMAVLAGHGLDRVVQTDDRRKWSRRVLLIAGLFAALMGTARLGVGFMEAELSQALLARAAAAPVPPSPGDGMLAAVAPAWEPSSPAEIQRKTHQVLLQLKRSTSPFSGRVWWPVLVLIGMAVLLRRWHGRRLALGVLLLLYSDLWRFGADYNVRYGEEVVQAEPASLAYMESSGRTGRTATVDRRRHPELDTELIASSMGLVFGTQDVIITSPLRMVRTEALLSKVGLDVGARGPAKWDKLLAEPALLDLLGVRWLLSEHAISDPRYPAVQVRQPDDRGRGGGVLLYENLDPTPPAFLVGCAQQVSDVWAALDGLQPRQQVLTEVAVDVPSCTDGAGVGTAALTRLSESEIHIQATARSPAMLVQTDTHYPGWVAEIDGEVVPIHRVNLMFRGIVLTEGEHTVVLRYEPPRIRLALWLALAAAGLLSLLALLGAWRARPQRAPGRS